MNFFNKAKTLTILACSAGVAFAAPTVEIGTWGNFCKGAVTFSFDDNTPKQLSVAQPMFDAKGFRMTLNTATSTMSPNWSGLKNAFAKGHEIASHSVSHADLSTSPNVDNECKNSKSSIEQNVPGAKCVTIAYPMCNKPADATLSKYYIAGRTCSGNIISSTETNFFGLGSYICGSQGKNSTSAITSIADEAAQKTGWAVFLIHCIDGAEASSDFSPVSSSTIKGALDYLDTKRSSIWVETFGNIVRYMKERKDANVSVTSSDDKSIKLTLKDNLDNEIYNYPLSLRTELPSGWTNPTVTQGGKAVKDTVVIDGSKKYVMFQAVPDGGDIVLTGDGTPVKEQIRLFETGKMVLIDNNYLSINSHLFSGSNINVWLFNLNGKVIANYTLNNSESSVALPSKKLRNETYFVKVSDGRKTYTEKVTPQL